MTNDDYQRLYGELCGSFSLYVVTHLESPLLEPITDKGEPSLMFFTDAPGFNAWSLQAALKARETDDVPDRPTVLYYVPGPNPPDVDNVDWTKARFLARFILTPDHQAAAHDAAVGE